MQTVAVTEPAKISDYTMFAMQLKQQVQGKARTASEAQKQLAKIEDNRTDFF